MREKLARRVAYGTAVVVILLALVFARVQNPPQEVAERPEVAVTAQPDPEMLERGRRVYEEQDCSLCHAIAGEGNPRNPLDGVGQRRDPEAMRHWMLGTGPAADELSGRTLATKEAYRELPQDEIDAVVTYLRSL